MARGINKATIIGTCGQDPEVRYMPNGDAVCNLSLATNEEWTDKQSGQKVQKTEWHRITLYGKVAEIAGEYVRKGSQVYIEGKLQTREWEKDGIKRYTTEIVVDMRGTMQLLGGRPEGSNDNTTRQQPQQQRQAAPQGQRTQQQPQRQQQAPSPQPDYFDGDDSDIPF